MAEKFGFYRGISVVIILLLAAVAAYMIGRNFNQSSGQNQTIPPATDSPGEKGGAPVLDEDQPPGLKITLSDGGAQPESVAASAGKPGEPLTLEEINNILLRLPPLATDPDDRQAFRLPEEVLPPPRTGETIPDPFPLPPEATAPDVLAGPLEVLRYSPEGEVPIAPFVNVTFNQPMVPLATLEDLSNEEVARPDRTLPAGNLALAGDQDAQLPVRFRPDRPHADGHRVHGHHPGRDNLRDWRRPGRRQCSSPSARPRLRCNVPIRIPASRSRSIPLFFISFDQRIDPGAVLETIQVEVEGGDPVRIRLATDEEIAADEDVSRTGRDTQTKAAGWSSKPPNPCPKPARIRVADRPGYPFSRRPAGHPSLHRPTASRPMRRSRSSITAAPGTTTIARP